MSSSSSSQKESRALLVGCPFKDLKGVQTDLEAMQRILKNHGFKHEDIAVIPKATKADITKAWDDMIDKICTDDAAVVIYYSGHGGVSLNVPEVKSGPKPRVLQYLVPVDFEKTTENDWRGITDIELSQYLLKTTKKTTNVTIILDCCHSSQMARVPGRIKSIDPYDYREIMCHLAKIRSNEIIKELHLERNPHVVSISAAASDECAYERRIDDQDRGCLTHALEKIMYHNCAEKGGESRASWWSIMLQVQELMKKTSRNQHPSIDGSARRFAFQLEVADPDGMLTVSSDPETNSDTNMVLEGGFLHGVQINDVYSLHLATDYNSSKPKKILAKLTINRVGPLKSNAEASELSTIGDGKWPKDGLIALFESRPLGLIRVVLDGFAPDDCFYTTVKKSKFLDYVEPGEQGSLCSATVKRSAGEIKLLSHENNEETLLGSWPDNNQQRQQCVAKLESLARAQCVLGLRTPTDGSKLVVETTIEGGQVVGSIKQPWPEGEVTAHVGDCIYISIENHDRTGGETIYAWIFGVSGENVELLSTACASGRPIAPGEAYTYGNKDRIGAMLVGNKLTWPEDTPHGSGSILETYIVILANASTNLSGLETNAATPKGPGGLNLPWELARQLTEVTSRLSGPEILPVQCKVKQFKLLLKLPQNKPQPQLRQNEPPPQLLQSGQPRNLQRIEPAPDAQPSTLVAQARETDKVKNGGCCCCVIV